MWKKPSELANDVHMVFDSPQELRDQLKRQPHFHFVAECEFQELLVSRLELRRCGELGAELSGVENAQTGERYYIETERLNVWR